MRNIAKISFLTALLCVCLTGCRQATYSIEISEDQRFPVRFSGEIQTRMVDNTWETNDRIGVFMFKTGQTDVASAAIDNSDNRKYIYSSISGENIFGPYTENDALYYPQVGNVDFVAYYPYRAVEDYKLKLDVSVQADPSSIDLLYSNNLKNIEKGETPQTLQFTHRLSKTVFDITAGEGLTAADLAGLKLSVEDIASSATLDIFSNTLTLASNSNKTITANTNAAGTQSKAILLPQTCKGKKVKVVLANRRTYTYTIDNTETGLTGDNASATADETKWEASYTYTYKIVVNRDYYSASSLVGVITEWTATEESTLDQSGSSTIEASVWDGSTTDFDWYNESEDSFNISTAEELAGFAELVNDGNNFEGKTVNLLSDIDLNDENWTPIAYNKTTTFKGTFNGGNHTVNGLAPVIRADGNVLGLFGDNSGTIENVVVSGSIDYDGDALTAISMAGVAGMNRGTIKGCRNYASVSGVNTATGSESISLYIGGIAGYCDSTAVIEDCQNQGVIKGENTNSTSSTVIMGGITGYAKAVIRNSENNQSLRCKGGKAFVGGIVGNLTSIYATASKCYNYGSVTIEESKSASIAGGIVGNLTISGKVSESFNYAEVTANITNATEYAKAGGIAGQNNSGKIVSSTNNGAVSAVNTQTAACAAAGGIVGYNQKGGTVHKCTNGANGSAQSAGVYGGIAGQNNTAEGAIGYIYSCCTNNGTPTKWIGSASGKGSLAGVTTSEHTDE